MREAAPLAHSRGVRVRRSGVIAAALSAALVLSAVPASAESGVWERLWGGDVVSGGPAGFEVCTTAAQCQAGQPASLGGDVTFVEGIAVDQRNGDVWVSDSIGNRIEKFHPDGSFVLAVGMDVGGPGVGICTVSAQCTAGGNGALGGQFHEPAGMDTDADGNVYVADRTNSRIQEFAPSGAFVRAFGFGVTAAPGFSVCTVAASCTTTQVGSQLGGAVTGPVSVAVGADGSVYVGDETARITKFATTATPTDVHFVSAWGEDAIAGGGSGYEICEVSEQCQFAQAGGAGGSLFEAVGISVHAGEVFVLDGVNNDRVQVYSTAGAFERAWGKDVVTGGGTGAEVCTVAAECKNGEIGGLGGELDVSQLVNMDGISVSGAGDVYVAESHNHRVQVFGVDGSFRRTFGKDVLAGGGTGAEVCTVAAQCKPGVAGTLGGELSNPFAVEAGPDHTVYVGDTSNNRVQRFRDTSAGPATFAFSSATYSHAEGSAAQITVVRSGDLQLPVRVSYATSNGTATAGADYTATSGSLAFGVGQTTATFDVPLTADLVQEADETITLTLSAPSYGDTVGSPGVATLTVLDVPDTIIDSGPTGLTYLSAPYFGFHGSVAGSTFQCRLDGAPFAPCASPFISAVLTSGAHTFEVRSITPGGSVDPTPAQRAFVVGKAESVRVDCTISPFATSGNNPDTCRFGSHVKSCGGPYLCVKKDLDCPAASRCTVTTTADWADADPDADWVLGADANFGYPRLPITARGRCNTGRGGTSCHASATSTGIADPRADEQTLDWDTGTCFASLVTKKKDAVLGPDRSRSLRCTAVVRYEPVAVLAPVGSGATVQLLAPGPGTVSVSPTAGRLGSRAAKPAFAGSTLTVPGAGVVSFRPKLTKEARKKLKRGRRVKLTVHVTYRSLGGTVATQVGKVVLQKPTKTSGGKRSPVLRVPSLF